jgi:hypothetical protein
MNVQKKPGLKKTKAVVKTKDEEMENLEKYIGTDHAVALDQWK